MQYLEIIIQTIILFGAIAGVYVKLKTDIDVLKNDVKWIKKSLFNED